MGLAFSCAYQAILKHPKITHYENLPILLLEPQKGRLCSAKKKQHLHLIYTLIFLTTVKFALLFVFVRHYLFLYMFADFFQGLSNHSNEKHELSCIHDCEF